LVSGQHTVYTCTVYSLDCTNTTVVLVTGTSLIITIIVKKLDSLKRFVRTTVAASHN